MAQLNLSVVTPEKTLLECLADAVVVPLFDGSKGILPKHAPMIGGLGPGLMTVNNSAGTTKYFIEGGFVQVDNNTVSVLTNVAMPVEELKVADLLEKQSELKASTPDTPAEKLAKERQLNQVRAMLQVAQDA